MIAETNVLTRQTYAKQKNPSVLITRYHVGVVILMVMVLLSGFGLVYMRDWGRQLFIQLESLQHQRDALYVEWGQLLLEQSTWATQARVQTIAVHELNMDYPQAKDIVMVKE